MPIEPIAPVVAPVIPPVPSPPVVTPDPDPAGAEALGDAGKKALDTMKAERAAAKADAKAVRDEFAAFRAAAEGKAAEYSAEQDKRKVEDAALAKANERILKAEIRAAAAGKLADPKDALLYLDLASFEVGTEGEVDSKAVLAAIEALVKSKPYLAAQGGSPGVVFESPGTHRNESPGQLTQADVSKLYAAKKYDEIEAARVAGRLTNMLGAQS